MTPRTPLRQQRPWGALAVACALLAAGPPTAARAAFHDRGVGHCNACHVTHEGSNDQVVMQGSDPLLVAATPTDVCLTCHGGNNGVFGANPLVPPPERGAGNFVFLLEDNLNDGSGGLANPIAGEAGGHSIVSLDMGTTADSRWDTAPGGTFPSASLGCTSCHDPHGNTNFRMLYGAGPIQGDIYQFDYPAPTAEGLDATDPVASEARDNHTAYQDGMSDWCANCHGYYHGDTQGPGSFSHHVNETFPSGMQMRYDIYDGASNPTGGTAATAYLPDVPFEDPAATVTSTAGPGPGARVMCLTCHRAHASSGPASGRWDFNVAHLDDDGLVSGSWAIPNPYGDALQGQLCVKCHRGTMGHDVLPTSP